MKHTRGILLRFSFLLEVSVSYIESVNVFELFGFTERYTQC
jgi:hypothetical protein